MDRLLEAVGEFGVFQTLLTSYLSLEMFFTSYCVLASVFIAATPDHQCVPTDSSENVTFVRTNQSDANKCFLANGSEPCQRWVYDRSVFKSTVVTEWDLVCDRAWIASTIVAAAWMFGRLIGTFSWGIVADRFGRWPVIFWTGVFGIVAGIVNGVVYNPWLFFGLRVLHAILVSGHTETNFVLLQEFCGVKWRVITGSIYMIYWAVGYMLFALLGYLIREWRTLFLICNSIQAAYYVVFFFFVPESPRWQFAKGYDEKAMKTMRKIAKVNGREAALDAKLKELETAPAEAAMLVPADGRKHEEDARDQQTENAVTKQSSNPVHLFRTHGLRIMTLVLFYNWFANSFAYYGLTFYSTDLGGDPFINCFLSGLVEVPAYLIIMFALRHVGRISFYVGWMVLGSVMLLTTTVIPPDMHALIVTVTMIGRLGISITFTSAWIYTAEVFPTVLRGTALNLSSASSRAGSILASYIGMLARYGAAVPQVLLGAMGLLAAVAMVMMPETKGRPLPQTVAEGEKLYLSGNRLRRCCRRPGKASNANGKPTTKV